MAAPTPAMIRRAAPGARRQKPKPREGSKREEAMESPAKERSEGDAPAKGGRLTMAQRRNIPKSEFGVPSKAPGSGSYPMENRAHAIAAKRMDHNADPEERKAIEAKANRILGRKAGPGKRR